MDEKNRAHKVPTAHRILIGAIDHVGPAKSCLDLAYAIYAILERGTQEKSWKHVEAALVMLDYLCQGPLDDLLGDIEEVAEGARILEGVMALKPALDERRN